MDQASMLVTALKMMVALGAVLLLFGGAIFVVRRFVGTSQGFQRREGKTNLKPLEILAYQSLGPGRSLYLIRCLDKKVLIGTTNQNVNHVADIDEPLEEAFTQALEQRAPGKAEAKIMGT